MTTLRLHIALQWNRRCWCNKYIKYSADVCSTASICVYEYNLETSITHQCVSHLSPGGPSGGLQKIHQQWNWSKREFYSCFLLLIKPIYFCASVFLVFVFSPHWPKNSIAIQEKKKEQLRPIQTTTFLMYFSTPITPLTSFHWMRHRAVIKPLEIAEEYSGDLHNVQNASWVFCWY